MITLEKINNRTLSAIFSSFCDVAYLGAEWGDTNVVENSKWSNGSATPIFQPIDSTQWTDATFKFLVEPIGESKAVNLEKGISLLASLFRDKNLLNGCAFPEADFGAYKFGGHCTAIDVNRIGRENAAEVKITMQGFKYIEETIHLPSVTTKVFTDVVIPSPIRLTFDVTTDNKSVALYFAENELDLTELAIGNYALDSRTKTFTDYVQGFNYASQMSVLLFPVVPVGGMRIYGTNFTGTMNPIITCYRRIL